MILSEKRENWEFVLVFKAKIIDAQIIKKYGKESKKNKGQLKAKATTTFNDFLLTKNFEIC